MSHVISDKLPNTRVFDVIVQRFDYRGMPIKLTVIANSFEQASAAAVKEANRLLVISEENFGTHSDYVKLEPYAPAHVTKMEIVRERSIVFRHEKTEVFE